MRLTTALAALFLLIAPWQAARSQASATLTLDELYTLPVDDAAKLALGTAAEGYVERLNGNGIQGNYVLGTTDFYSLRFYKHPESIGPGVCGVGLGQAVFEVSGVDFVSGRVSSSTSPGAVPLTRRSSSEAVVYFATPGDPQPPPSRKRRKATEGALATATDPCAGPVGWRDVFEAETPELVLASMTLLREAVTAARGGKHLKFKISRSCRDAPCKSPRATLAALNPTWTTQVQGPPCRDAPAGEVACHRISVRAEPGATGYWDVSLSEDAKGRLLNVRLDYAEPPVI